MSVRSIVYANGGVEGHSYRKRSLSLLRKVGKYAGWLFITRKVSVELVSSMVGILGYIAKTFLMAARRNFLPYWLQPTKELKGQVTSVSANGGKNTDAP